MATNMILPTSCHAAQMAWASTDTITEILVKDNLPNNKTVTVFTLAPWAAFQQIGSCLPLAMLPKELGQL
jgi:hypothetical protein